jgi:major intracellular serine protease
MVVQKTKASFKILLALAVAAFPSLTMDLGAEPKILNYGPKGKTVVVAVVDTGFDRTKSNAKLCKYGHADFSRKKPVFGKVPMDTHGHGTNVAQLIADNAGDTPYCLVIINFYRENATAAESVVSTVAAFNYASTLQTDILNFSGGGNYPNSREEIAIKKLLNKGVVIVAAAGNDGIVIDKNVGYYPAMYDSRIFSVGNLTKERTIAKTSNRGPYVNTWEIGTEMAAGGVTLSGTSQATAVKTGKIVREFVINRF